MNEDFLAKKRQKIFFSRVLAYFCILQTILRHRDRFEKNRISNETFEKIAQLKINILFCNQELQNINHKRPVPEIILNKSKSSTLHFVFILISNFVHLIIFIYIIDKKQRNISNIFTIFYDLFQCSFLFWAILITLSFHKLINLIQILH